LVTGTKAKTVTPVPLYRIKSGKLVTFIVRVRWS